jgi:hypothetical protein
MNQPNLRKLLQRLLCISLLLVAAALPAKAAQSRWVYPGPDGKLIYATTPAGDRIMDFSFAGYMGGGVPLPDVPVVRIVPPNGNSDDTSNIQAAINQVSSLPLRGGFRGAVLLMPGVFTCSRPINIAASGVVLRGSGSGAGGTTIRMVGPRHRAIMIGSLGSRADRPPDDNEPAPGLTPEAQQEFTPARTSIADRYVPAGSSCFRVVNDSQFLVGDTISIRRPTTLAWIRFMGMNTLRRDGKPQTWIGASRGENTERKITAISGNLLTLDIPLSDSFDARYLNPPGTSIVKIKPAPGITQVGVENLHIQCPPLEIDYGHAPYSAIRVGGDDCWVKDIYCEETMNSTVLAGKRITMEKVVVTHTFPNLGASKPTDFSIEGSQNLIDRCHVTGGNEYFVWTVSLVPGPNVVLNSTFTGRGSRIQPHMRWSSSLLVDNCDVPDGGIDFMNRGVAGSGHGWTMGWAVAWNCIAKTYVIQQPPGAANWAIGCIGQPQHTARLFDSAPILPVGYFDSPAVPVAPRSLYLAQLEQRLGKSAIRNIGYANDPPGSVEPPAALGPWPTDIDPILGPDLAVHRPVNTSNVRQGAPDPRQFAGEKAVDGIGQSYWATDLPGNRITLELDMEGPVDINALDLSEAPRFLGRVRQYKVEGEVNSDWKLLSQGTTIGPRKVDRFPTTTVWKVRLTILNTTAYPAIRKFGLYCTTITP